ncbi:hypothetical protein PXK01_02440 [Phaeobacter sp. PT47_59]|uniref:AbiU2 domain-containing protein n=1 Tax=Phaeobacter sp. PT47_59 TaxID=3029979 RepID=UPI00238004E3|nr:hypothetical protein [Phaeobacter sp. PT47_59]MDE4172992.1 hypothetical protein [Phaeobacter sp. PT47_59]
MEQLKQDFELFREQCTSLAILVNTFEVLFENEEGAPPMNRVAPEFFCDLNGWMVELYFLYTARILDSAGSKKQRNLSVDYFLVSLREAGVLTDEITDLGQRLKSYLDRIGKARRKLIAHNDRAALRKGEPLGQHSEQEKREFLRNLQSFCDAVGRATGVGPCEFLSIAPGDVVDLLRLVKRNGL